MKAISWRLSIGMSLTNVGQAMNSPALHRDPTVYVNDVRRGPVAQEPGGQPRHDRGGTYLDRPIAENRQPAGPFVPRCVAATHRRGVDGDVVALGQEACESLRHQLRAA